LNQIAHALLLISEQFITVYAPIIHLGFHN